MSYSAETIDSAVVAPRSDWPLQVYEKSALKQEKFAWIARYVGDTDGLDCLDIGSETGAISYLLRSRGGNWKSTDHEPKVVQRIEELVGDEVYLMEEPLLPFPDNSFDMIVVVDILEHVEDDRRFVDELHRTLRPNGTLILNSPRTKRSVLTWLQTLVGLTNENLGRVRAGYDEGALRAVVRGRFEIETSETYRGFFSKLFESVCLLILRTLPTDKMGKHAPMVSKKMLDENKRLGRAYSLAYPLVRMFCSLDRLLPFAGYMLIAKARPINGSAIA